MSDAKHSPGPWAIRRSGTRIAITGAHHTPHGMPAVFGGFLHVCDLSGDECFDNANAALIIAAPELLAELKVHRECLHLAIKLMGDEAFAKVMDVAGFKGCGGRADAAIAKAEGGAK